MISNRKEIDKKNKKHTFIFCIILDYIDAESLFYICRLWKIRNFVSRRANEIINFRKNQNFDFSTRIYNHFRIVDLSSKVNCA